MTAGHGITHTEETPVENTGRLNGVQLWVALPEAHRNRQPAFGHHPTLPVLEEPGSLIRVILGDWHGHRSEGAAYSPMVGAEITLHSGTSTALPLRPDFEHALIVLSGEAAFEGQPLQLDTLYYLGAHRTDMQLSTSAGAQLLLIGGTPFSETILMWWNFVARTQEEIAAARSDWEQHLRFEDVRAYQGARLRAPQLIGRPITR
ncbi:MAG: pirin-like C-terminal cupin domain-containing protein [Paludibaculum sp.]